MNKLIVANWKMQITHNEVSTWLSAHGSALKMFLQESQNSFVVCPSFTDLSSVSPFVSASFHLGAQDCSMHERGAYTGEVSAISLKQIGCSYTIIGHSERRQNHAETSHQVAQKAALLLQHDIEPILCIGETQKERDDEATLKVLEKQLTPLVPLIKPHGQKRITIAYEPVWAVGSHHIPRALEISLVFNYLQDFMRNHLPSIQCVFLYGGSVNERTITDLGLSVLDGFLLGRAGVEWEVLKKIILSC